MALDHSGSEPPFARCGSGRSGSGGRARPDGGDELGFRTFDAAWPLLRSRANCNGSSIGNLDGIRLENGVRMTTMNANRNSRAGAKTLNRSRENIGKN